MRMQDGKPELCGSWTLLGKLVARGVFQAPCGCTLVLVQEERTRVLLVVSMGLQKPHPMWPPIQALARLINSFDDVTTSYLSILSDTSDSSIG